MAPHVVRQNNAAAPMSSATIGLIAVGAVVLSIFALGVALRCCRKRYPEPKYIPTQFLKDRWRKWQPVSRTRYKPQLEEDDDGPTLYLSRDSRSAARLTDMESTTRHAEPRDGDVAVGRNTSVRSVMTLPAYSRAARENEQILGREGERDGIDVLLEAPETIDEEEGRREEEMESLYQIRRQRRQEIAEREERRQRRQEARDREDYATLRALRQESALRAQEREATGAMAMIAEHQSRSRERRVSSVSYGDLGVARHDGSRIRTGSAGSDRQPLLDSAASISGRSMQPALFRDSLSVHARGHSSSSLLSTTSIEGPDLDPPPFGRSGSDFEIVTLNQTHSRNASASGTPLRSRASSAVTRPSIDTTAPIQPPAYDGAGFEEAPPYVSPTTEARQAQLPQIQTISASGAPLLPEIGRLPSIRIAAATPIEPQHTEQFPPF